MEGPQDQERISGKLPEGLSREEAREAVEQLPIASDVEKVDLILTLLDFKVGTDITVPDDEALVSTAQELLHTLRLFYVTGEYKNWYIAKSQSEVERLHQVFEVTPDVREQGRMSGYPESAVENYARTMELLQRPGITQEEVENILRENGGGLKVPPEIQRRDFMSFENFQLSANNWQDELEVVKKWAEAIREFDPLLYKRTIDRHHRTR